ncbi:hypothetical protein GLYMA_14G205400v4 [Glycine max]|nr:hypothetical protein GLYMA_14G205400v4 [Glycine max]KAH1095496.1 hypothetical protein GYH30_040675 [Glycine max]
MNNTPIPPSCLGKHGYIMKLDGVLDVSASDISDFCNNGCKSHTLDVLSCIQDVKRDFYFGTKQNVSFVKDAIINACAASQRYALNTNVTKDPNSATSLYGRLYVPLVSTLTTMAFIATFGV